MIEAWIEHFTTGPLWFKALVVVSCIVLVLLSAAMFIEEDEPR